MRQDAIRVLIVEDNPRHAEFMEEALRGMSFDDSEPKIETVRAHCGEDALETLRRDPIDIVLLDYGLPDYDGLDLLKAICDLREGVPVVFVTSQVSVKVAVEAMKRGACDYLVKDEQYLEMLPVALSEVIRKFRLREDNRRLKEEVTRQSREISRLKTVLQGQYRVSELIAFSPAMQRVLPQLERAIESTANVLLEGETGTGKEVLARAIHLNGARRRQAFVAQNCAALPESLLESELFGVARGAFTGADRDRKGLFEEAHRGTLFLDEIGEMPFHLQAKLLRGIQEREVRPLGSTRVKRVDVRIIAATNLDLERSVEEGKFRKDLYYRLSVLPIRVPPLRERREDIPAFAEHFLRLYGKVEGKRIPGFTPEAMTLLERYAWPGNVRQLENETHRLVAFCSTGQKVDADLVSDTIRGYRQPFQQALDAKGPLRAILDRVEAQVVLERLRSLDGNKTATALSLGVNRETLYQKLAKHDIPLRLRPAMPRKPVAARGGRDSQSTSVPGTGEGDKSAPEGTEENGGTRRS